MLTENADTEESALKLKHSKKAIKSNALLIKPFVNAQNVEKFV
jgi:hypothetical protein